MDHMVPGAAEPSIEETDQSVREQGVLEVLELDAMEAVVGALLADFDDLVDPAFVGIAAYGDAMVRLGMDQRRQNVAESPLGSNAGVPLERYTRWFSPGSGPQPWCAYFVSWCLDRASDSNRRVPWTYPGAVQSIHQWASGAGRLVRRPLHGDIFGLGSEHCGLVAGASADGATIWTVEGNYDDRVSSVSRRSANLWFARL
jgi:hypothetical protein